MAGECILAIDQGTTNTKALLVDGGGRPVARAAAALKLATPAPDFVEQDAAAVWESVVAVAHACREQAGERPIAAIAISNQRETAVAWERATGRPVAPAMSWQCRRSAALCERLQAQAATIRERTGLQLDPLLSAGKWRWLLDSQPELRGRADRGEICFGTIDAWLLYKFTGGSVHATDFSNASRTGLLNLATRGWDADLLDLFEIPAAALAELRPSAGIFGTCTAIEELAGVPILAVMGDSHAALAGHGRYHPGTVKATYGTGSSLMTLVEALPAPDGGLARTIAWTVGDETQYALEGNITMTGSAVQWVGEFLGLADPVADTVALAGSVADSAGVSFVPGMVGLGAPHWDALARGTICGLGRSSTAAHLARAALESIAFQVADVFEAMQSAGGTTLEALEADGGATRNDALMQFQADILGCPVHRSACEDLSALGAAWFSGLALGWWKSMDELEALAQPAQTFEPAMEAAERDARMAAWKLAVARTLLKGGPA